MVIPERMKPVSAYESGMCSRAGTSDLGDGYGVCQVQDWPSL